MTAWRAVRQPVVRLDGSHGEGGGQILRTALFLSTLLDRPFRIDRIRATRPEPGLKAQHAGILRILQETTGARCEGASVGSPTLTFDPGPPRPGAYAYDVGTAGSVPLILQTMLPVALLSPERFRLRLTGGTDVAWGPTIDWVTHVIVPLLRPLADSVEVRVERRGFYPRGGGLVELAVSGGGGLPARVGERLAQDRTRPGRVVSLGGASVAHASLAGARVAERQAEAAAATLREPGWPGADIARQYVDSASNGTSLTLWTVDEHGNRMGSDGLGAPGRPAEHVGADVARRLIEDARAGATVDRHLADHLVPWVALGMGPVRVPRVTDHLTTNLTVCRAFLGPDAVSLHDFVLGPGP